MENIIKDTPYLKFYKKVNVPKSTYKGGFKGIGEVITYDPSTLYDWAKYKCQTRIINTPKTEALIYKHLSGKLNGTPGKIFENLIAKLYTVMDFETMDLFKSFEQIDMFVKENKKYIDLKGYTMFLFVDENFQKWIATVGKNPYGEITITTDTFSNQYINNRLSTIHSGYGHSFVMLLKDD